MGNQCQSAAEAKDAMGFHDRKGPVGLHQVPMLNGDETEATGAKKGVSSQAANRPRRGNRRQAPRGPGKSARPSAIDPGKTRRYPQSSDIPSGTGDNGGHEQQWPL
jgi:hypothetical protein